MVNHKLRGALYGCGMISEFHLRAWQRIPEVELVAIGNRTLAKAEARRDTFYPNARVYSSLADLLAGEELDFIDILTIPSLHRRHCAMAAERNLHIICQKPLCDSLADARALAADLAGYPRIAAVHENHRFRPWFQRVRREFDNGAFGAPHYLEIRHLNATSPGETYKNEVELGVLFEYGSHLVDMMRALLGEPTRVYARFMRPNPAVRGESLAHVVYEYPRTTAVIAPGWKNGAITQGSLLLVGDEGEAFYEGSLTRASEGRLRLVRKQEMLHDAPLSPLAAYIESFYLLQRECVEAMLGNGTVTQTLPEHLRSLEATFAAYDSARSGRLVPVPD